MSRSQLCLPCHAAPFFCFSCFKCFRYSRNQPVPFCVADVFHRFRLNTFAVAFKLTHRVSPGSPAHQNVPTPEVRFPLYFQMQSFNFSLCFTRYLEAPSRACEYQIDVFLTPSYIFESIQSNCAPKPKSHSHLNVANAYLPLALRVTGECGLFVALKASPPDF